MIRRLAWAAVLVLLVPGLLPAAEVQLEHVDVFNSGADGYHTFRIPEIETAADGTTSVRLRPSAARPC